MEQLNLFTSGQDHFKIKNKVRLIELFAGIGSQAKALERLGIDFENWVVCEFDEKAIQSYNAVHGTDFPTSDITKLKGSDLSITETDKYTYILTYSFPCQDLSLAGKQRGMKKGSNTRSSLLYEVERLLNECIDLNGKLPQVLLMENVPQVHSEQNREDFRNWIGYLESIGYNCFYKDLNAKNYGIPQNRERTFMVSVLGNYFYDFPSGFELKLKLKDVLEDNVDECFYLSDDKINKISQWKSYQNPLENVLGKKSICPTITARGAGEEHSGMIIYGDKLEHTVNLKKQCDNKIVCEERCDEGLRFFSDNIVGTLRTTDSCGDKRIIEKYTHSCNQAVVMNPLKGKTKYGWHFEQGVYDSNGIARAVKAGGGSGNIPKVIEEDVVKDNYVAEPQQLNLRIRKVTPKECWRLMGFDDEDFEKAKKVNSNTQLYKQAGNSIVVDVLYHIFKQMI